MSSRFSKLEKLIDDILDTRPPFYEGNIVVRGNASTIDEFNSIINRYMDMYQSYGNIEKRVNNVNINGVEFSFKKDEQLDNGVYIIDYE